MRNKSTHATNGPDDPIDAIQASGEVWKSRTSGSRSFKSGQRLGVRYSTSADGYQIFLMRPDVQASSQNNNLYLGTSFSVALSRSLSRLYLCGLSPSCPPVLIMDCAVECRSQRMSTFTSTWLSGIGAEGFLLVFVILSSRI